MRLTFFELVKMWQIGTPGSRVKSPCGPVVSFYTSISSRCIQLPLLEGLMAVELGIFLSDFWIQTSWLVSEIHNLFASFFSSVNQGNNDWGLFWELYELICVKCLKKSAWHSHRSRNVTVYNHCRLFSLYLVAGTVLGLLWDVIWFSQQPFKVSIILTRPLELEELAQDCVICCGRGITDPTAFPTDMCYCGTVKCMYWVPQLDCSASQRPGPLSSPWDWAGWAPSGRQRTRWSHHTHQGVLDRQRPFLQKGPALPSCRRQWLEVRNLVQGIAQTWHLLHFLYTNSLPGLL